jgi:hypothetical protein
LDPLGGEDFMATIKCKNCGTTYPEEAAFCPECGAPKNVEQKPAQPQQPAYQQPQPQPVRQMVQPKPGAQMAGMVDSLFSKFMIMLGVCIGILLVWIGVILRNFAGSTGISINGILAPTGFAGIGLLLFGGGFLNKNIDKYVRMGMIISGGLSLVFGLAGLNLGYSGPLFYQ